MLCCGLLEECVTVWSNSGLRCGKILECAMTFRSRGRYLGSKLGAWEEEDHVTIM